MMSRITCCLGVLYTMLKTPTKGSLRDSYERRVPPTTMIPPARWRKGRAGTGSKKHSGLVWPSDLCLSCRGHVNLVPLYLRGSCSHSGKREISACAVKLTPKASMKRLWKDTFGTYHFEQAGSVVTTSRGWQSGCTWSLSILQIFNRE
jgi:hypothetical protein